MIGEIVDRRYRLDKLVGEGGMGLVFAATHVVIGKKVAVKVLRREHARDEEVVSRFLREAQLASSIKHPNVVDLTDFGQLPDGRVFYVMELLEGRSLANRIDVDGPLPPRAALTVGLQIAKGLAAAHAAQIVHRDLKPDNVYLCGTSDDDPRVKLFDFGIARAADSRLTRPGAVLGTPEYMSPEQATGTTVDARADLYALGVILFEMLTGQVPFAAADIGELIRMQLTLPAPKLGEVAGALSGLQRTESLIARLLAKTAPERPSSADEVIAEISAALESEAITVARRATQKMGSGAEPDSDASADDSRRTVAFRGGAWSERAPPPGWSVPADANRDDPPVAARVAAVASTPIATGDRSAGARMTEPQSLVLTPARGPVADARPPRAARPSTTGSKPRRAEKAPTPVGLYLLGGVLVAGLGAGAVLMFQNRDAFGGDPPPTPAAATPTGTPAAVAQPAPSPVTDAPASVPTPSASTQLTPNDQTQPPPPTPSDPEPATDPEPDAKPAPPPATAPSGSKAPRTAKRSSKHAPTKASVPGHKPAPAPSSTQSAPADAPPSGGKSTESKPRSFELKDPFGRK